MAAINTPFPTIQPSGPNGPTAQEFTRLQGNIANAIKNIGPSVSASPSSPVVASYYLSANQTPGAGNPINFDISLIDTGGTAPLVTMVAGVWKFTAKVSGYYYVTMQLIYAAGPASDILVYKNNVAYAYVGDINATTGIQAGGTILSLSSGDFIDIRIDAGATIDGSPPPYHSYVNIMQVH